MESPKRPLTLTLDNVITKLKDVEWNILTERILDISLAKKKEYEEHFQDETTCRKEAISFWLNNHPHASWRFLIIRLYRIEKDAIAEKIKDSAETLSDETLNCNNVSKVTPHVDKERLGNIFCVPGHLWNKWKKSLTDAKYQQEVAKFFCDYSYSADWSDLAGRLYYWKQHKAVKVVQKFIKPRDRTLTTENIIEVLRTVSGRWREIAFWLNIQDSDCDKISKEHNENDEECGRKCWTQYITEHPSPTWKQIAYALYLGNYFKELKLVQGIYLKGTNESRPLFEQAMKEGSVNVSNDKIILYGSPGVGKTSFMNIFVGKDPPSKRNSTPLAVRPVAMYQWLKTNGKWCEYKSKERKMLFATISKHLLKKELLGTISATGSTDIKNSDNKDSEVTTLHEDQQEQSEQYEHQPQHNATNFEELEPTGPSHMFVDDVVLQAIDDVLKEMVKIMKDHCETEDAEPPHFIRKLLITDCGGQPEFHEMLPSFLKRMSLIVFVFKLSEELSSYPLIEYYEDGKSMSKCYKSDVTTEQLIQQGIQSLHSHLTQHGACNPPRIVMLGTHKDKQKMCRETKNRKEEILQAMLFPRFKEEIVYSDPRKNEVLFSVNTKSPKEYEESVVKAIQSVVSNNSQSDPQKLPLKWLGLEILLEILTSKLGRSILTINECRALVRKLNFNEKELYVALEYLNDLSLIFYFPDILPEIVFTDPQVILRELSELVKLHHSDIEVIGSPHDKSGMAWQEFYNHALISSDFLSQSVFSSHYVTDLFRPDDLLLIFQKKLIIADFAEGKHFVPSLLRMLNKEELEKKRISGNKVAPLVIDFSDGLAQRGIFCALVSFLTSRDNIHPRPWKIKMKPRSVTPVCLHRNCIEFIIPDLEIPCTLTLIDAFFHFELHLITKELPTSNFSETIKCALSAGIESGLKIAGKATLSSHSFALLCPCGKGDSHSARFGKSDNIICNLDSGEGQKCSSDQLFWTTRTVDVLSASNSTSTNMADFPDLQLSNDHFSNLFGKVSRHSAKWREIGVHLGFHPGELDDIQARPLLLSNAPKSWLEAMLAEWIQWAPGDGRGSKGYATLHSIWNALVMSGEREAAQSLSDIKSTTTPLHT